ncbi:MAG TPA: hypothetical protein VNG69_13245 [Casimicrobiaceae bacterium]|nr:hypothetical protein [Casimicrobiaceae bacterium]
MRPDPGVATSSQRAIYDLVAQSVRSETARESARVDGAITAALTDELQSGDGKALLALLNASPSVDVYRYLWRLLAQRAAFPLGDAPLGSRLFAIPLVIVAGLSSGDPPITVHADIRDLQALREALIAHGALGGNRAFALSNALVATASIDIERLPTLMGAVDRLDGGAAAPALDLKPASLSVVAEAAHLRFLVGTAMAARDADLFKTQTLPWSKPLAQLLMRELRVEGVSSIVLPRPALSLPAAVAQGRAAQREVAAQLFMSQALRELRGNVGEPTAVISAHRAADAIGSGELRLSLSSALSLRDAYGFRAALYPNDRVEEVVKVLTDLLEDYRVVDVRLLDGVHDDRDAITKAPLMFKPDTIPSSSVSGLH